MVVGRKRIRELDQHPRATAVRHRARRARVGVGGRRIRSRDIPGARHRGRDRAQHARPGAARSPRRRGGDDSEVRRPDSRRRRAGVAQRAGDRARHLLHRRRSVAGLSADPAFGGGIRFSISRAAACCVRTRGPMSGPGWPSGIQRLPWEARLPSRRGRA